MQVFKVDRTYKMYEENNIPKSLLILSRSPIFIEKQIVDYKITYSYVTGQLLLVSDTVHTTTESELNKKNINLSISSVEFFQMYTHWCNFNRIGHYEYAEDHRKKCLTTMEYKGIELLGKGQFEQYDINNLAKFSNQGGENYE